MSACGSSIDCEWGCSPTSDDCLTWQTAKALSPGLTGTEWQAWLDARDGDDCMDQEVLRSLDGGVMREIFTSPPRPDWDDYFLGIAEAVAARGECSRSKVGAVLVKDRRIRSTGYNGAPSGAPSCLEGACPRAQSDSIPGVTPYDNCIAIHAEANALLFASKDDCEGATLYVTREPCHGCSKLIAGAGVTRVITPETVALEAAMPAPVEEEAVEPHWLEAECERAKKRMAQIPEWARPVVTKPTPEPEHRGCTCGHPGLGCYCY